MPRELKDGPMACKSFQVAETLALMRANRKSCGEALKSHITTYPDVEWQAEDGPGQDPTTDFEKASLKLVTKLEYEGDKLIFPPENTRLSDEYVYMATKMLQAKERGAKYPYDFTMKGDIDPGRIPSGAGPIVWANGFPFFPVFKGYYILTGRQHADWIGWKMKPKVHHHIKPYPMWTIGPVVAPGSAVELPRTIERQAHYWKPQSAKECQKKMDPHRVARDVVSQAHQDLAIVPKDSKGGFLLSELYHIDGYDPRVGPRQGYSGTVFRPSDRIPKSFYRKHGVTDFDYNTVIARPYENRRKAQAFGDDESDDAGHEKENKEKGPSAAQADSMKTVQSPGTAKDGDNVKTARDATKGTDDSSVVPQKRKFAKSPGDNNDTDEYQAFVAQKRKFVESPGDNNDTDEYQAIAKNDGNGKATSSDDALKTPDAPPIPKKPKTAEAENGSTKADKIQASANGGGDVETHNGSMTIVSGSEEGEIVKGDKCPDNPHVQSDVKMAEATEPNASAAVQEQRTSEISQPVESNTDTASIKTINDTPTADSSTADSSTADPSTADPSPTDPSTADPSTNNTPTLEPSATDGGKDKNGQDLETQV